MNLSRNEPTTTIQASLLLAVLVILTGSYLSYVPRATSVNEVSLPILVYPTDGHNQHIEPLTVYITEPGGADSLYIQAHQLGYHKSELGEHMGYDTAADVRINGGDWIPISNDTATCKYPEKLYECVGGAFHTIRLEVPIANTGPLVSGANTIEFRFNGTDGTRSGYRILNLELRNSSDVDVIDGTSFIYDDPTAWDAPVGYSHRDSIADGEALWKAQNVLTDWSLDQHPVVEQPIKASCADCHARSGSDLKYFNYSNRVIVSRSRMHGLTESEGKKIAAYIRSVDLNLPSGYTVTETGRPWNPPYQPGPGLDDQPIELWSAGAGLEWVLTKDEEMEPYLQEEIIAGNHRIDSRYGLNVRELPVAFQYPDWNNWLPDIAPEDVISNFKATTSYSGYANYYSDTDSEGEVQSLVDATGGCGKYIGGLEDRASDAYRDMKSIISHSSSWSRSSLMGRLWMLSKKQWTGVRQWEVVQENGLQDLGEEMLLGKCDNTAPYDSTIFLSDRRWPGGGMQLFRIAPHMDGNNYPAEGPYATSFQNVYFSSAWYELQTVVNIGIRGRYADGGNPVDWNYQAPHIDGSTPDGHSQLFRYTRSYLALLQFSHGLPDQRQNPGLHKTFTFRQRNFSGSTHGFLTGSARQEWPSQLRARGGELPKHTAKKLLEAAATEFVRKLYKHPVSAWPRCSDLGQTPGEGCFEDPDFVPSPGYNQMYYAGSTYQTAYDLGPDGFPGCTPAASWYDEPDHGCGYNVRPSLVDSLADWGEAMWPQGDWEQFMISDQQSITLEPGWNLVSGYIAPDDPDISAVFSEISDEALFVEDANGNTYSPSDGVNEIETWDAEMAYLVYVDSDQELSLVGEVQAPDATLSLSAGWNVVPFLPKNATPIQDALNSISDKVMLVKDESGQTFIPGYEINEIGNMKPGEGYKIFVSESANLTYPTQSGN